MNHKYGKDNPTCLNCGAFGPVDDPVDGRTECPGILRFMGEHAWLSNFHRAEVKLDGVTYPTVEHAYHAAKTFDKSEREGIRRAATAATAKKLGKRVKLRDDWEDVKLDVMLDLLRQKFSIPRLCELLLGTADTYLAEGNWWKDRFWGVDHNTGEGLNWLGVLIMQVREELNA